MKEDTVAALSILAGLISLASGLFVFFGFTRFVLGLGLGVFSLRRGRNAFTLIGLGMSVVGILLAVAGLFR